ncbi:hypothetical protein PanWU01x14_346870 [Parasponia andersonii]|uniref:Uncharacterized protein n=1 Tax=Parasponia andersonii TaxID=3476 RepID=A0A2P5AC83_PARAD|nr:hypothetical protein PanWU01x14_346870 [Parasponia andersonii]
MVQTRKHDSKGKGIADNASETAKVKKTMASKLFVVECVLLSKRPRVVLDVYIMRLVDDQVNFNVSTSVVSMLYSHDGNLELMFYTYLHVSSRIHPIS